MGTVLADTTSIHAGVFWTDSSGGSPMVRGVRAAPGVTILGGVTKKNLSKKLKFLKIGAVVFEL